MPEGFLLGEGANSSYDKERTKRLEALENLPPQENDRFFHFIDLIFRDNKTKQDYTFDFFS